MRAILGCGLAAVLVFAATAAAEDKIDAAKLVGKWEPKEKEKAKFVIEFTKDGKVSFTAGGDGKELKFEGTYKLDGNKMSLKMKFGDKEDTKVRVISKLTDTELTSKEEGGTKEDTLVRVGGK